MKDNIDVVGFLHSELWVGWWRLFGGLGSQVLPDHLRIFAIEKGGIGELLVRRSLSNSTRNAKARRQDQ